MCLVNEFLFTPGFIYLFSFLVRWDHSGFRELYPDEADNGFYKSSTVRDNEKK